MFKLIRIFILLVVLASVWATYQMQKNVARDWQGVVSIRVIPIVADDKANTLAFVSKLKLRDFEEVGRYLKANAKRYERDLSNSFDISLEPALNAIPPTIPKANAGAIERVLWSLKLRWWAWRHAPSNHSDDHIRLYVLYQTPEKGVLLPHSTGLQNGLLGLIHARAEPQNRRFHNVILTHELLHIFGASDKYDLATGQPIFPEGYENPDRRPSLPQQYAEIMGRAIPISEAKHDVATRLGQTRVGKFTAMEIGWLPSSLKR